ncbi:hypothetical protein KW801_03325 [Candidatus Saccharibacteria bacterium]|nr:hypothetical protein [Candidatus Saccharibacteria bacterium]
MMTELIVAKQAREAALALFDQGEPEMATNHYLESLAPNDDSRHLYDKYFERLCKAAQSGRRSFEVAMSTLADQLILQ